MENKFAAKLTACLKSMKMNQTEFSKKVGVASNTVTNWCNGVREPDFNMLMKICSVLEETTDYMLGFDEQNRV